MEIRLILILLLLTHYSSRGQTPFQQRVDHDISVVVHEKTNTLEGKQKINYYNRSKDSLTFIWFHIWPNAYKNDKTAFSEQLLKNGRTDFYFSDDQDKGYINRITFTVNQKSLSFEDHPEHQDIIKLLLPSPLAPGDSVMISSSFHVKMPAYFSRSGRLGNALHVTQWYPKPAVYDHTGWHPMPYLDQGEFFNEFGKYKVSISLNQRWTVAATGRQTSEKMQDSIRTWIFEQDSVHDFAFFASPDYVMDTGTVVIGNRIIQLQSYHRKKSEVWKNSISFLSKAILSRSAWIGDYPYPVASVVELPTDGEDGMEYPTITLIANPDDEKTLESLIHHEIGHNWFYGMLASNERDHPWMDEGMNSYYDRRYAAEINTMQNTGITSLQEIPFLKKRLPADPEAMLFRAAASNRKDQPIALHSADFSQLNYGLSAYYKASRWMQNLEMLLGRQTFDSAMQEYFQEWKFKHPYPQDFRKTVEKVSGQNLESHFLLLDKKGQINSQPNRKLKPAWLFSLKEADKFHYISFIPLLGFNHYDKWMPGVLVHNYSLSMPRVRFFVTPLFSTESSRINGMAGAYFSKYFGSSGSKLEIGLSAARFTNDVFTDSTGKKNFLQFSKWVPTLTFDWPDRGSRQKSIQWKTFMLEEQDVNFSRDTVNKVWLINYPFSASRIHQLRFSWRENRVLYPWQSNILLEHGRDFGKINLNYSAFFNYPKGGGLSLRFFAGKFLYWKKRTNLLAFRTSRYHLNMTGPDGYEDYTYSNYFGGRNEFEGLWSQQIMQRDGGFKIRTDLLSRKIGKTDDWLTAVNLSSTIPDKMNPLSLMPIKIPLKLFADIGTYAESWKKGASGEKFLYDAGLQFSLLGNAVNIYVPLLYSKVFRDYVNSTIEKNKLRKTISFSIDLNKNPVLSMLPREIF